jgi:hypothetical protein
MKIEIRELYCDEKMMATHTSSGKICCWSFNPNTKQSLTSYYTDCTLSDAVTKFKKKINGRMKNK